MHCASLGLLARETKRKSAIGYTAWAARCLYGEWKLSSLFSSPVSSLATSTLAAAALSAALTAAAFTAASALAAAGLFAGRDSLLAQLLGEK